MISEPSGRARVGCSGWAYRDWRGKVYPPRLKQREWFAYYASVFDTVELNTTFYRLPSATAVEQWAAQTPPDFVYALKLGAFGSHRMKLGDAARWLPNHVDRARRLGAALGPTLVQLPPRWKLNVERLDEFLTGAHSVADARWLAERLARETAIGGPAVTGGVLGGTRPGRRAAASRRRRSRA